MKTAILIPCFNRAEHLELVLRDVGQMPQVRLGAPVFLACDGGPGSAQKELLALTTQAHIPSMHCLVRPENFGIGRNVYEAKRYLFDECHYDQVFYVEEDIRLSPHALTLVSNMQAWASANFTNGCVTGVSVVCDLSVTEKRDMRDAVSDCGKSMCNHLMTRDGWNRVKPWVSEYVSRFLQCKYNDRDVPRILAWMRDLAEHRLPAYNLPDARVLPVQWDPKGYFLGEPATSQDAVTALAIRLSGMSHIVTHVNRGIHIGKLGENSTEESWNATCGTTRLDHFDEDGYRTYFRLR